MKYTAVMPVIYQPYADACLASCKFKLLVVDNTVENLGVAASWNLGIDKMRADNSDWLIITSAANRYDKGGLDFLKALEDNPGSLVIEAGIGVGWHLIAFSRCLIEAVGKFDENFYPAYYEDLDYSLRIQKVYKDSVPWTKVNVQVSTAGWAHGVALAGVRSDSDKLQGYFKKKW